MFSRDNIITTSCYLRYSKGCINVSSGHDFSDSPYAVLSKFSVKKTCVCSK